MRRKYEPDIRPTPLLTIHSRPSLSSKRLNQRNPWPPKLSCGWLGKPPRYHRHIYLYTLMLAISGLDFTSSALHHSLLHPTDELDVSFRLSYDRTLSPHHSFFVRPMFYVSGFAIVVPVFWIPYPIDPFRWLSNRCRGAKTFIKQ